MDPVNLAEFEQAARERLAREAYEYYAGGANDEITLRRNRTAYEEIALHYPVLRDVSARDTSTTVLGEKISFPVMVAPTAFHRMACADGECAAARAAGRAGQVHQIEWRERGRQEGPEADGSSSDVVRRTQTAATSAGQ